MYFLCRNTLSITFLDKVPFQPDVEVHMASETMWGGIVALAFVCTPKISQRTVLTRFSGS